MNNQNQNTETGVLLQLETKIVNVLKNIFDPEIPVNIYDLGLIYGIEVDEYDNVDISMTLTAPNCPIADDLVNEVREKTNAVEGTNKVTVTLTFDPPWDKDMMSEEAMLQLGCL